MLWPSSLRYVSSRSSASLNSTRVMGSRRVKMYRELAASLAALQPRAELACTQLSARHLFRYAVSIPCILPA